MSWFRRGEKRGADKASVADSEREAPSPPPSVKADAERSEPELEAPPELFDEKPNRRVPAEIADLFLVLEEHLTEVEQEDIRAIVATIPQPPPLVSRLTNGLDEPEELRDAILSSPTLSADVLRVVNSAAFALNSPISSIEHAVTYLGTNMVKGLVVQSVVSQVLTFTTDVQKAAYMRVWRSSYIASATAQVFAEALGLERPSIYATRALLVGVGDLALMSTRPDLASIYAPKTTLLSRVEDQQREIMGNSAVLSALLAREWALPEDLYQALRYCLTPLTWSPDESERDTEQQRDDALLYFACRVGDAVAYGGLRDLADVNVLDEENPDVFYLPDYLRRLDLGGLIGVLRDPKRTRRIVHTMSAISG